VLWASPDRYREEFRLGPLNATYVAVQGKLYIRRNTPTVTYIHWRVRGLMSFPDLQAASAKIDVAKVSKGKSDGQDAVCAVLSSPVKGATECFAPASGDFVSSESKHKDGNIEIALSEDNFIEVGTARIPGHIVSTIGDERLEIQVDKLEAVGHFADVSFTPPDGASTHDWCAKPEVRKLTEDPTVFSFSVISGSYQGDVPSDVKVITVFLQAGPDGSAEKLAAIHRDGSAADVTDRKALQKKYPIHICGGKPVEYEEVFGMTVATGADLGPTQLEYTPRPGN
jgi:hypothetical protein